MKKENILTYLDQQFDQILPQWDLALDWDVKNHTIEIVIRLFADNTTHLAIDDANGVSSDEAVIEFEDGILLYDATRSQIVPQDYLATIPLEKNGLAQAVLDGLVAYLQEIVTTGQQRLEAFLQTATATEFSLTWSEEAFQECVHRHQKSNSLYFRYPRY